MRVRFDPLEARQPAHGESEPYRKLWSSVLILAVRDMNSYSRWRDAHNWMYSPKRTIGSANWVCSMLDLDYQALQVLCSTRAGRKKILRSERYV
jgi:hypothetical protein